MDAINSVGSAKAGSAAGNLRARGVKITPEVAEVLRRSVVEGAVLHLPHGQLEPGLYRAVDKTLKALGGRWDRKVGGHVFLEPVADALAGALGTGFAVDAKKTLEQFFTPPELAHRLVEAVELVGDDHVLEPSAGAGSLLAAAMQLGCYISAVEFDERLANGLTTLLAPGHGRGVWHADFLEWEPVARLPISVVLMNPPFSAGKDVRHVRKAFGHLAQGGRLAAIVGEHAFTSTDQASRSFRDWLDDVGAKVEEISAGAFKTSGTMVASRMLVVEKR